MKYSIFNNIKTVELDDKLVEEYEKKVAPLTTKRIEYHVVSMNVESMSGDVLAELVSGALMEEICVYEEIPGVISEMKKCGDV